METFWRKKLGVEALAQLRAEIEISLKELDAGLGLELDVEELIRELHEDYGLEA